MQTRVLHARLENTTQKTLQTQHATFVHLVFTKIDQAKPFVSLVLQASFTIWKEIGSVQINVNLVGLDTSKMKLERQNARTPALQASIRMKWVYAVVQTSVNVVDPGILKTKLALLNARTLALPGCTMMK